jgi:hypothetical protein
MDKWTDIQINRQFRQTDRQKDIQMAGRLRKRHTYRQTDKRMKNIGTYGRTEKRADDQTDTETETTSLQTNKWTDKQTGRQMDTCKQFGTQMD